MNKNLRECLLEELEPIVAGYRIDIIHLISMLDIFAESEQHEKKYTENLTYAMAKIIWYTNIIDGVKEL